MTENQRMHFLLFAQVIGFKSNFFPTSLVSAKFPARSWKRTAWSMTSSSRYEALYGATGLRPLPFEALRSQLVDRSALPGLSVVAWMPHQRRILPSDERRQRACDKPPSQQSSPSQVPFLRCRDKCRSRSPVVNLNRSEQHRGCIQI